MVQTAAGKFLFFCLICLIPASLLFCTAVAAGTETLISTNNNGFNHQFPKISGDRIVWVDVDSLNGFGIIHRYDITAGTETLVTDNTSYATNPAIAGILISYTDCGSDPFCGSSSVYLYDTATGIRTQLSPGTDKDDYSAIYSNRIVWRDLPAGIGTSQIYINDTPPGTGSVLNSSADEQAYPEIYGDLVTYADCDSDPFCTTDNTIYVYNISSGTGTQVSPGGGRWDTYPAIYGSRIVWQGASVYGSPTQIFLNGTSPGTAEDLTSNEPAINHYLPAIAGDWVVWYQENATPGNYDIYANDTVTHQNIPIALDRQNVDLTSISFSPADSLYRVVWDEQDAGGYNVYLYTSGTTKTCPVAGFSNDFAGGAAPVTVHFTDTSKVSSGNPITHWFWDFGDGTNSTDQNPTHTYNANGHYTVSLTVANPLCRNATTVTDSVVVGEPVARFSASATSTVVNAQISFTDSSLGSPTEWDWYWGDGIWTNGTTQNPQHAYAAPGTYSVTLVATNTRGSTTLTKNNYIAVLPGASADANTTITGVAISTPGSSQHLIYNYTTLPSWSLLPDSSILTFVPPSGSGFAFISITTSDTGGFTVYPGNTTIAGTISAVHLQTGEIVPAGFSAATGGPSCSVNYSVNLSTYPVNALLTTQVWEGAAGSDATSFNMIAQGSRFGGTNGTAYTTKITKTNFPSGGTATLHMSLNASWVAGKPYGRNAIYVERIDDSGTYGQVLATRYLAHNATANLDYFEATSPNGLSTFGLSALQGSGNLFQLVTLTVSSQIAGSSGGGGSAGAQTTAVPKATITPEGTPDTGKTAFLYINANSVITQATTLQSNDKHATLRIGEGTVAKDANGAALSSVTIRGLLASEIPAAAGDTASSAGMAYDLGPGGATFSPAVTLTFTNFPVGWGNAYTVRSYDTATRSWQDLPTVFDPANGTITAQVSHFCTFALFTKPVASAAPQGTPAPGATPRQAATPAPPAPTAVSTFLGLVAWIAETTYGHLYLAAVAVIAIAVLVFMRRRRQDPLL